MGRTANKKYHILVTDDVVRLLACARDSHSTSTSHLINIMSILNIWPELSSRVLDRYGASSKESGLD